MYLKSLVLKGFKSFADRSVMAFEPGITWVDGSKRFGQVEHIRCRAVGSWREKRQEPARPGYGRRHIRRVIRPKKPRHRRGRFGAGQYRRDPSGGFPAEVSLTRRMYRSGESEYLVETALPRAAWTSWTSFMTRAWERAPAAHHRAGQSGRHSGKPP